MGYEFQRICWDFLSFDTELQNDFKDLLPYGI